MGVGREGATGLYKADITCAIKQRGLNLELYATQCQVRNVLLKVYNQLQVAAL